MGALAESTYVDRAFNHGVILSIAPVVWLMHLATLLLLRVGKTRRPVHHLITKSAIAAALAFILLVLFLGTVRGLEVQGVALPGWFVLSGALACVPTATVIPMGTFCTGRQADAIPQCVGLRYPAGLRGASLAVVG